jgi:hypothetical protein
MHNIHQSGWDVQLSPGKFFFNRWGWPTCLRFRSGWRACCGYSSGGRDVSTARWAGCFVTFAIIAALHGKDYYLAPAYPMLFAGGSVVCESWLERARGSMAEAGIRSHTCRAVPGVTANLRSCY